MGAAMHDSVHTWVQKVITSDDVKGKDILEVGSMNVNGTVRPYITSLAPKSYLGIDIRGGPGVDAVCGAASARDAYGTADVVISTEMLEHAEDWHAAFAGMVDCVRRGGVFILTTRGPGFAKHDHPGDYWRFTDSIMHAALTACGMVITRLENDPEAPGIFAMARKPDLSNVKAIPVE